MRLLELFAGTGSVGKAFTKYNWDVLGLDITKGHAIKCDILQWDYTTYPPGSFDAIHASPPCTQYSIARTSAKTPRNLTYADELVSRTIEIIQYLQPTIFIIENPYTGLMKSRPVMQALQDYMRVVTYCSYGTQYKKATAIWTNLGHYWIPRPMCAKHNPCVNVVNCRHTTRAQIRHGWTTKQLYVLPHELCMELAKATTEACYTKSPFAPVLSMLHTTTIPYEKRRRVRDAGALKKRGMVLGLVVDFASPHLAVSKHTRRFPELARSACALIKQFYPTPDFSSFSQAAGRLPGRTRFSGP